MRPKLLYSKAGLTEKQLEIREIAEKDLKAFVSLVAPSRVLGHCHHDMLDFLMEDWERQLVLWPRAHQKSAMIAFWTAWHIIKHPDTTVLYVSDNSSLAEAQLGFVKQILDGDIVKKYWPGLLKDDEGKRQMWRNNSIAVDHWKRQENLVRDPTIRAAGIGTGLTGFHFDVAVLDDIVVYDNSATPEERNKCETWYSLLSSIINPGGIMKGVGTRYHPKDLYQKLIDMEREIYNEQGEMISKEKVWKVSQRVVEIDGEFLWPRTRRAADGEWFGFNKTELSKKKNDYINKLQFYAQYYNNPNDPEGAIVTNFQYYEPELLRSDRGVWSLGSRRLNVYASIDFASTVTKRSDYTCIVVVGVDADNNIYVLDIDRFKTDKISVMTDHLIRLYTKWNWLKLRAEATAAQNLVVNQIKEANRKVGIFYSIESFKPSTDKETRMRSILEPRYAAGCVYHYRGGNCQLLEEELVAQRPPHDDIKDALSSVMDIIAAPSKRQGIVSQPLVEYHSKFGGVC